MREFGVEVYGYDPFFIILQIERVRIKHRLVSVKHLLNYFSFLVEQINFLLFV